MQEVVTTLVSMMESAGPALMKGVEMAWEFATANEFLTFLLGSSLVLWGFGLFKSAKRLVRR